MIYDHLTYLSRYRGLHANIDRAIDYILTTDLGDLEVGRHEVDGEAVFFFVQDNQLNAEKNERYEYHKRYMDIQLVLEGEEFFRYCLDAVAEDAPFDEANDIGFAIGQHGHDLALTPETVVFVYPGELHQPSQQGRGGDRVKKCVFKVAID